MLKNYFMLLRQETIMPLMKSLRQKSFGPHHHLVISQMRQDRFSQVSSHTVFTTYKIHAYWMQLTCYVTTAGHDYSYKAVTLLPYFFGRAHITNLVVLYALFFSHFQFLQLYKLYSVFHFSASPSYFIHFCDSLQIFRNYQCKIVVTQKCVFYAFLIF